MKYLKKFKEAVIHPDRNIISNFINELRDRIQNSTQPIPPNPFSDRREGTNRMFFGGLTLPKRISFISISDLCEKYDIELVNYNQFYADLPDDQKSTAPPRQGPPLFALINPITGKIRLVYLIDSIDERLVGMIDHIIQHELVHIGQKDRGWGATTLADPNDSKNYFSNKYEIMAFSQSISNELINMMRVRSTKEGMLKLDRTQVWATIKKSVSEETLRRYKKYIYLYLVDYFTSA